MQLSAATEVASVLAKKRKLKVGDDSDVVGKLTKKQRRKIKQLEDAMDDGEDDDEKLRDNNAELSIYE